MEHQIAGAQQRARAVSSALYGTVHVWPVSNSKPAATTSFAFCCCGSRPAVWKGLNLHKSINTSTSMIDAQKRSTGYG